MNIFELRDKEKWGAKRSSPGGGRGVGLGYMFSMNKRKGEGGEREFAVFLEMHGRREESEKKEAGVVT